MGILVQAKVDGWRLLCVGRFLACVIGWLVVCGIQHRNSGRAAEAVRESYNLSDALESAQRRISQLTGAKLDKMGREELLELVSSQRSGLEQTEHVLDNLPSLNKDVFAPTTPKMVSQDPNGSTFNPMMTGFSGMSGGPLTPSRSRAVSMLPASISSKAPPSIVTNLADGESPV